jgi:CubicO group peptidase (beta-lactamase class C family)
MILIKSIILILIITFVSSINTLSQELNKKIDDVLNEFVKLDQFSGTILVAKDGDVLYAKAFGEADKDHHVKNTLETKFNIGSIGKIFTGTAIMQLVEKGELNINDPVINYLADFPFGDKIKIHHLLTHTSGTFNYFAHPDFITRMNNIRSVSDALHLIYEQKLRFDTPGEQFSYSNSGIVILGAVIEKVTGRIYEDYIKENILVPAGMYNTGINYFEEIIENRATGYVKSPTGKFQRNIYMAPPANADGGIETTVEDLLKFDQALYGTKILNKDSKQKMFTPFKNEYGYCWRISKEFNNTVIGHGGGAPGISAMFRRFTDDKYTVIVLSNYSGGASPVARTIEAIIFNQEYELPKPSLSEFLYQKMKSDGIKQTSNNFAKILSDNGYEVRSQWQLNALGYALMNENKMEMAIEIFKLNTELFPKEVNTYDSLGDAYLTKGDKETSIIYYKKALEIDPNFESSKNALDTLLK